jgi:hypothetical protein
MHSAGRGRPSSSMLFRYRNIRLRSFGPRSRSALPRHPIVAGGFRPAGGAASRCRRRHRPSPSLRYEPGACPRTGEPVTPHFAASPDMPPNTASRGAPAPAGTRLTCSPTAAGSCSVDPCRIASTPQPPRGGCSEGQGRRIRFVLGVAGPRGARRVRPSGQGRKSAGDRLKGPVTVWPSPLSESAPGPDPAGRHIS